MRCSLHRRKCGLWHELEFTSYEHLTRYADVGWVANSGGARCTRRRSSTRSVDIGCRRPRFGGLRRRSPVWSAVARPRKHRSAAYKDPTLRLPGIVTSMQFSRLIAGVPTADQLCLHTEGRLQVDPYSVMLHPLTVPRKRTSVEIRLTTWMRPKQPTAANRLNV